MPPVAVSFDLLCGGAGLELLIGHTRLGNLLALLDQEEVPEIKKHLFGTVCLTPRKRSGPPYGVPFGHSPTLRVVVVWVGLPAN